MALGGSGAGVAAGGGGWAQGRCAGARRPLSSAAAGAGGLRLSCHWVNAAASCRREARFPERRRPRSPLQGPLRGGGVVARGGLCGSPLPGYRETPSSEQRKNRCASVCDLLFLLQPPGTSDGSMPESAMRVESLRELLVDLIVAYADPAVQEQVRAACGEAAKARGEDEASDASRPHLQCLARRLQPVIFDVVRTHGFPPTSSGLKCLQNAVHRRISEGDTELHVFANEAVRLLGLGQVEQFMHELRSDELLFNIHDDQAESSHVLLEDFLAELEESEGVDTSGPARRLKRLYRERCPVGPVSLAILCTWSKFEKVGLPVKCFVRESRAGEVARLHRPSANVLFEYVLRNEPLVITGAVDEQSFTPLQDFRDFSYLKSRCGQRYVKMKTDASWDSAGRHVFINDPTVQVPFGEYLDMIEDAESRGSCTPFYMGKMTLVEELPELSEDIDDSPSSPWKTYGRCFGPNPKGLTCYFGSGRNTTALHSDPSENLTLVMQGTKTFELFPPSDVDCLYPTLKKPLISSVPPFTSVDAPPAIVQERCPLYRNARPMRVDLVAGDILYLPIFWWHSVTGGVDRNMTILSFCDMHPRKVAIGSENEGARFFMTFVKGISVS